MYLPSCLNSSTSESGGSSVEGPCSPCIAPTSFSPGGASDDTVILPRTESLIWSIKSTSMATRISYSSFTVWCWSTTTAWKSGLLWNRHGFKGVRAKMLKTFSYRRKMIIQEDSVVGDNSYALKLREQGLQPYTFTCCCSYAWAVLFAYMLWLAALQVRAHTHPSPLYFLRLKWGVSISVNEFLRHSASDFLIGKGRLKWFVRYIM